MAYYPIFLNLTDKKALVVGGGRVARRKVDTLLEYGAAVFLVSKKLAPGLRELVDTGKISYVGDRFDKDQLEGIFLVISATDDPQLNHLVSRCAEERGLLINAVDQPEDCNFIVPSIMRRGDLQVAISTAGKSPALARKIRENMERSFGEEYETMLRLMGKIREAVLSRGFPQKQNKRMFEKIVASDLLDAIKRKDSERIGEIVKSVLGEKSAQDILLERVPGSKGA